MSAWTQAHRDLKPENLCLGSSELDVKLVDFGVATEVDVGRRTFCGSMSYVAPEVLRRKPSSSTTTTTTNSEGYSYSVDMWSLGVTVHVILSCTPPFNEDENSQMHEALPHVLRFHGEEWDTVSDEAKDFVTKCLEVRVEHRLTAKQALEHTWLKS